MPKKLKARAKKSAAKPETGPWLVEVSYKSQRFDPAGNALAKIIKELDPKTNIKPRVSHLYLLEGTLSPQGVKLLARELLEDPVIQTSGICSLEESKRAKPKTPAVDVWLKSGVTDVVAQTIETGLKDFNVENVRARSGIRYSFPGLKDQNLLKTVARNFLVNPLIHAHDIQSAN